MPGERARAGLTQKQAEVAATSLSALPSVAIGDVTALVDGEEEGTTVQEGDIVTATVRVTLTRGSHALPGAHKWASRLHLCFRFPRSGCAPRHHNHAAVWQCKHMS